MLKYGFIVFFFPDYLLKICLKKPDAFGFSCAVALS